MVHGTESSAPGGSGSEPAPAEPRGQPTFRKEILVAVDGSEGSLHALGAAVELAKALGGRLTLLEVIEEQGPLPTRTELPPPGETRTEYLARKRFEPVRGVENQGVPWVRRVVEGSPPETICRVANELGSDLIVVGSRGLGALARVVLGSVSGYVVHHAPCPVLVTR